MTRKELTHQTTLWKAKILNLLEEHPSHKCMIMVMRKNISIPCISSISLLPNIADLSINIITTEGNILKKGEEYAKIILLLFYPYRIQDDLMLHNSYWDRCIMALDNNMISFGSMPKYPGYLSQFNEVKIRKR